MADRKGGKGAPGRKAVPDRKGIPVSRHMPGRKQPVLWIGCGIVLLILAAWHFLDVRAGVLETGETWLYGWYGGLCFLAALTAGGAGICGFYKKAVETGTDILQRPPSAWDFWFLFVLPPLSARMR